MINVFLLAECLGGFAFGGQSGSEDAFDLRSVRLFSDESAAYDADCLHVLPFDDLGRALKRAPAATFAVFGSAPPSAWNQAGGLLVVPGSSTASDALESIDAVFRRFEDLERSMFRLAVAGRSMSAVLALCSELLVNPIVVSDSTFCLVGRSEPYDPEHSDAVTADFEQHGYVSEKLLPPERIRQVETSRTASLYRVGATRTLQTCIRVEDKPAGFIGSSELYGPFTEGQVALVWWINGVLEELWPLLVQNNERQSMSEQVVARIIGGEELSGPIQARALAQLRWPAEGRYRLLCFFQADGAAGHYDGAGTARALGRAFPSGVVVRQGDEVLVALQGPQVEETHPSSYLHKYMLGNGLACTASAVVHAFSQLGRAYRQCAAARSTAAGAGLAVGTIAMFEGVVLPYLLGLIERDQGLAAFCHPGVELLAAQNNGAELVHSLRLYLACGQNMARAARALYVHRSTLAYRIELVERTLGCSLDEIDEAAFIHLHLSCLIVEGRSR